MKKNKSWRLCKLDDDLEGMRLYKVSSDYILTNLADDVLAVVPRFGRSRRFHRAIADLLASGFEDTFWEFASGHRDDPEFKTVECFLCSERCSCSCLGSGFNHDDCIVRKGNEEEFGT